MKKGGLSVFLLSVSLAAGGQSVSPTVPDFTDITAPWVEATTGTYENPFRYTGVAAGRHTVITAQGADLYTGGNLALLPPGESRVVRLGNEFRGREAESVSYRFVVDVKKSVLLLKFAVVMQNPNHARINQPRFVVRILDKNGYLVESCAEYDVYAGPGIEGFKEHSIGFETVQWRDWTSVGLDLSALAGQEVQVQFITYDCDHSGHFGYAYFTAACVENRLQVSNCTAQELTLKAPGGFASYTWQDGSSDTSRVVSTNAGDVSMACEVVSVTGCRFTLSAFISSDPALPARDTILRDTVCEGDEYHRNYYHLPAQNKPGDWTYYNTFFDPVACGGDVTTTLFLTVVQRYFPLEATICRGEDYTENGFRILQPASGIYQEKITVSMEGACEQVRELRLVVSPSPEYPQRINGEQELCAGSVANYEVPGIDGSGQYRWEVPEHVLIVSGQGTGRVRLLYTDEAASGTLTFTGINGCGESSVSLPVTVHPSYYEFYADSVCAGSVYDKGGFVVPAQPNGTFYRMVTQPYRTYSGCDSIRALELSVSNTPVVGILSQDTVVCPGDEVVLEARILEDAEGPSGRRVYIGDVVCTDGAVLPTDEFLASGKEAKGVVFYVARGGRHGKMISLDEIEDIPFRGTGDSVQCFTLPEVPLHLFEKGTEDMDGYTNTALIRTHGTASEYPAAFAVDFEAGWYIPGCGELRQLLTAGPLLNETLERIGATEFKGRVPIYWSSTRTDTVMGPMVESGMWMMYGIFGTVSASNPHHVRSVAAF
ncbi:MAG: hypothetical protein LBR65_02700 [Culturomica sp.]|jgi:hypothetical protein|nr:hypothetical protein [Culturomica sp.]